MRLKGILIGGLRSMRGIFAKGAFSGVMASVLLSSGIANTAMADDGVTVINMPPPPPSKAKASDAQAPASGTPASGAPASASAAATEEVTVTNRPRLGRVALGQYAYGRRGARDTYYTRRRGGVYDDFTQRWSISPYGHYPYGGYDAYLWPGFWSGGSNCGSSGVGYSYRWSFWR